MEYTYYWYHHGMSQNDRQRIHEAIESHNFEVFISFYKKYTIQGIKNGFYSDEFDCWFPIVYFSNSITVFDGEEIVDDISIFDRENFNKITFNECENG